jgi:lysylphosphatidylglycerol synthetase-like protein (DUF2156 family)
MSVPLDLRVSLLRQYGSFILAYSVTFQPDLDHFGDERGFLAYKMVGRTALVLSDPVAPWENHVDVICRFVHEKRDVCFLQISRPIADIVARLGFTINEMGVETNLELSSYSMTGPDKRNFRTAVKRMAAAGNYIEEGPASLLNECEIKTVSDRWRRTRATKSHEIAFLARPIVFGDEVEVRKFWTFDRKEKLLGFAFFDPVYDRGKVIGYLNSVRRRLPEADSLVTYALMYSAIEKFRSEGIKWLSVGLSPLAEIEDKDFPHSWFVRRAFRFVYMNALFNRYVYPLQGLANHKRGYGGITRKTYFAFNTSPPLLRLLKSLQVIKLV